MPVSLEDCLVVGISSRALFDLHKENEIFEQEGLQAYSEYQIAHEDELLEPGSGFSLVKALLRLNELSGRHVVEVIIMSRNSADTSLRVFSSIEHYGLDITRAVLSGGENLSNYLASFGVDLFLSADEEDVRSAVNAGFAAGIIYPHADDYQRRRRADPHRLTAMPCSSPMSRSGSIRNTALTPLWSMSGPMPGSRCPRGLLPAS
ncbi:MAG: 5'-nucleotidase [Merdibacter sp.]